MKLVLNYALFLVRILHEVIVGHFKIINSIRLNFSVVDLIY